MQGRTRFPRFVGIALRSAAALAALGWAWYMSGLFRTQQFGPGPAWLALALLFAAPAAALPFVGLRPRELLLGAAAVLATAAGAAEGLASFEEYRFRHDAPALAGEGPVMRGRLWPFADHHLLYDPATRTWGAGD